MDRLNSLLSWLPMPLRVLFDHNRWVSLAAVMSMAIGGCSFFGEPKTESPASGKPVTERQLQAEAETWAISFKSRQEALNAESDAMQIKFKAAFDDLDVKKVQRANIAAFVQDAAAKYVPSPIGVVAASIFGLLFAGAAADNRRKDAVIYTRTPQPESPEVATIGKTPVSRSDLNRARAAATRKP